MKFGYFCCHNFEIAPFKAKELFTVWKENRGIAITTHCGPLWALFNLYKEKKNRRGEGKDDLA